MHGLICLEDLIAPHTDDIVSFDLWIDSENDCMSMPKNDTSHMPAMKMVVYCKTPDNFTITMHKNAVRLRIISKLLNLLVLS